MAAVFAPYKPGDSATIHTLGSLYLLVGTVTFSGSYATGGDSLDLGALFKQIGLGEVLFVSIEGRGHDADFDKTNKKLKLYSSNGTELAAAGYPASLTASAVDIIALGK